MTSNNAGQVNKDRMLARKPLYPAEKEAAQATVCVTGAAGYVGSRIVARLLAAGHNVHATCRSKGDDEATMALLHELPGAGERLKWFHADLMQAGSFDAAVEGCRYVVHAAGVVTMNAPKRTAYPRLIEPTIKGIEHLLGAVNKAATVEKVVLTSSLAAVSADFAAPKAGGVFTEADWPMNFMQLQEPYVMSKVLAEWQAWAVAGQQRRWKLVTICPGHVYGPPMTASQARRSLHSAPVATIRSLLDGSWWPFTTPTGLGWVDLDDVAAAHCLALANPEASGRYLLVERWTLMSEMADMMRTMYPRHKVPFITLPFSASAALLVGLGIMSYKWVKIMWQQRACVDCSKAVRELGLTFIPLEQCLRDCSERLMELGVVPAGAPRSRTSPVVLPSNTC